MKLGETINYKSASLFKNKNFLMYWISYVFSALGDAIYFFVIPWMIKEITGSGIMMGMFLLVVGVPRIILMLLGGVVVDRFDGRKIMFISDISRAMVMLGIFILMVTNSMNIFFIFTLGFVFGVLDAFYWPAVTAIRQRVVSKEHYVQSNSLLAATWQITALIGPLTGAFLYHIDKGIICVFVIGIAFIASALTLYFLKLKPIMKEKESREQKNSIKEDLAFGVKYVLQNHLVFTLIITMLFANMSFRMLEVGLPFLAESLKANEKEFGLMQSALGAGGLVVSFILTFIIMIKNPSPKANMLAISCQGLGLLLLGLTTNYWQAIAAIGFIGIATAVVSTIGPSIFQKTIPEEVMGRVSSINMIVAQGAVPLAQAAGGWFLDTTGPNTLFITAGIVETLTGLVALMLPAVYLYNKREKSHTKEVI
jgi:MFS transporter, DHA3 family, macrolide efflux protein